MYINNEINPDSRQTDLLVLSVEIRVRKGGKASLHYSLEGLVSFTYCSLPRINHFMLAVERKYISANRRRTLRVLGKYVSMYAYNTEEGKGGRE